MKRARIHKLIVVLAIVSLLLTQVTPSVYSRKLPKKIVSDIAAALIRTALTPERFGKLPLSFEANMGQVDPATKFILRNGNYQASLLPTGVEFVLRSSAEKDRKPFTITMGLAGANPNLQIQGNDQLPGKTNYFIGNDPANWRTNLPNYAKVRYASIYPGIDLIFYGNEERLEYDFVVAAGANPNAIRMSFTGVQQLAIEPDGALVLQTPAGVVRQLKPVVYQERNGQREYVEGRYKLTVACEVGFEIEKYDPSRPLVIDPVFVYSTYHGGAGNEVVRGVAVDSAGSAYIIGSVFLQRENVFVAKLNQAGTALAYLTFLGGTSGDSHGYGIAVGTHGHAFLTGFTTSATYPTLTPFQANRKGWANAFLTKLTPTGQIMTSTYFGGSDPIAGHGDFGLSIALDPAGNVLFTGETTSADHPVANAFQPVRGGLRDSFVAKMSPNLDALLWSTFLGGSSTEGGNPIADSVSTRPGNRIAVDRDGNCYVTGYTSSPDLPVVQAFQPNKAGEVDAYVAKFSPAGVPIYITYLGGTGTGSDFAHGDYAYSIACDASGAAVVVGDTTSQNYPTVNPIRATKSGPRDLFVTKINPLGSAIVFSTYFGGSDGNEGANGVAIDAEGNILVTGVTSATNFPTSNLLQPARGGADDAFLFKVNPFSATLMFSSYIGGSAGDSAAALAIDETGKVYLAGSTVSPNFPTTGPMQPVNAGQSDAFIAKIDPVVFSVIAIQANRGGNTGEVTAAIIGGGFEPGAMVKLVAQDQPDIQGVTPIVNNSSNMTATFDLRGAPIGVRDVVVTLPNGSTSILRNGFMVEEGRTAQPWIDVIGRSPMRTGRSTKFEALVGNPGNIDEGPTIAWIAVPQMVELSADVPYVTDVGGSPDDPFISLGGKVYAWFLVDKIGAGEVRRFSFNVKSTTVGAIDISAGLIRGDAVLQTVSSVSSITSAFSLNATALEDTLQPGDLVFKLSDPSEKLRTGHVGIYVGNGNVVDMVTRGNPIFDGYYRRIPLSEWAPNNTFAGSGRPAGVTATQANQISLEANRLYDDWISGGAPFVPYLAPAAFGSNDCVSTVGNIFRRAGVQPSWGDWYPPGALFEQVTAKTWPETKGVWRFLNLFTTKMVEGGFQALINPALRYTVTVIASIDPNDKVGAIGTGTSRFITGVEPLRYVIYFENLETATAAAQEVVIKDQLDLTKVELSSFEFGPITIGDRQLIPPPAASEFIGTLDLRPENDLVVKVVARFDKATGLITWKFSSLNPATGLPTENALAGFLPPNTDPPNGEGSVFFTIDPKSGQPTGTAILNQADIIFDENAAIQTPTWLNTLDNSSPASSVLPLAPTQSSTSFEVRWNGTDNGSGIRDFSVFVSQDGQPYTPWLTNVTTTQSTFVGQAGSTYSFYSIARDLTNNQEGPKNTAEATTHVEIHDPTPQFLLKDFVVLSKEFTGVHANVSVFSGNVGTNRSLAQRGGEEVEIGEGTQMPASSVVGDTLRIRAHVLVQSVFFNELSSARSSIVGQRFTPLSLPLLTLPTLPSINPGVRDIEVDSGQTKTLTPGRYDRIIVKHRGTLILPAGVYEISSLDVRQNTKILFMGPAEVRVANEMDTDSATYIGPHAAASTLEASQIVFFVGGPDDKGRRHDEDGGLTPTAVQVGQHNTVRANIYAPNGTVWLKSKTEATGAFISKRTRIGEGVKLRLASAF